jgi:uncharacterized protein YecT (DUF1311 family)
MKRFIVAAFWLLLAGHVFAAEVSCEKLGEMAYNAAMARDRGTPQDEVARMLAKNYNDDRAEAITKVVFMHQDVDADGMQIAVRLWCLQQAEAAKKPAAEKTTEEASAAAPPTAPIVSSGYSHTFDVCMSKSDGVTVEVLDCTVAETSNQDGQLNKNYQAAMVTLPPERRLELRNAQRAWIKARDSKCVLDQDGGTAAQINSASCVLDMTAQRAKELAIVR